MINPTTIPYTEDVTFSVIDWEKVPVSIPQVKQHISPPVIKEGIGPVKFTKGEVLLMIFLAATTTFCIVKGYMIYKEKRKENT